MRELGITDHRFLGGAGRYRDSGMMGAEQNGRPGSFWSTPVDEAAAHLVEVIREVRPGPGHLRPGRRLRPPRPHPGPPRRDARRRSGRRTQHGSGAPHTIAKIYWNRVEREVLEAAFDRLRTTAPDAFPGIAAVADVPGVTDAEQITEEIGNGVAADRRRCAPTPPRSRWTAPSSPSPTISASPC
ncbi:1D-myo-inositol 2-acetamido-2-deoxy-alpha-D-glucopyranoside deacetylase OS=Streptomyces violarus OX=67380 GN=mshB PE=3 SV=1 [Streptomyces violarus]